MEKELVVAAEKIKDAIEVIKEQGIGIGMGVSAAKALDALDTAYGLIREVIDKQS